MFLIGNEPENRSSQLRRSPFRAEVCSTVALQRWKVRYGALCGKGATCHPEMPSAAAVYLDVCRPGVACSVTGVGEHITRALLARACAERMLDTQVSVQEALSAALHQGILGVRAFAPFRQTLVEF